MNSFSDNIFTRVIWLVKASKIMNINEIPVRDGKENFVHK